MLVREEREAQTAGPRSGISNQLISDQQISALVVLSAGKERSLITDFRPLIPGILRKEVIQPQVPLRLPCYDFTPVADPTVVGCLPCGLAHRLQVKPTPMV